MESTHPAHPASPLADEYFPEARRLEEIIDELALRENLKRHLEESDREWEETDHSQVRIESIERLRENILSHIHPYLAYFAEKAGWIQPRDLTYLINVHGDHGNPGYRGVVSRVPAVNGVARIHPLILEGWDRDIG